MKKIVIIESLILFIVVLGFIFPSINNTKSRNITPYSWVTPTSIITMDSIVYDVDTSEIAGFVDNLEITVYFDKNNRIYKKRNTRNDDIIFYFRTSSMPHYFYDKDNIHINMISAYLVITIFLYLVYIIIIIDEGNHIYYQFNNFRLDLLLFHNILEYLFIGLIIPVYIFTIFENTIYLFIPLIISIILFVWKFELFMNKVKRIVENYQLIQTKKNNLYQSYNELIK